MSVNQPAWLGRLRDDEQLPLELPADPSFIVVLTNRAGIVAATLRFAACGHVYAGARGGDMHLRALLVELFHERRRAAVAVRDKPFSRRWLISHFHAHLHAIEPRLIAHPPIFGNHPDLRDVLIGKPLPPGLSDRFALFPPADAPGFAPA